MTEAVCASWDNDNDGDQVKASSSASIVSGAVHGFATCPLSASTVAMLVAPSKYEATISRCEAGNQANQLGDDFICEVRLRSEPPPVGTTKMSPAGTTASLISPPIKAMRVPSGDH